VQSNNCCKGRVYVVGQRVIGRDVERLLSLSLFSLSLTLPRELLLLLLRWLNWAEVRTRWLLCVRARVSTSLVAEYGGMPDQFLPMEVGNVVDGRAGLS